MKRLFLIVGAMLISNLAMASNLLTNASFEDPEQDPWLGLWGDDKHIGIYGDTTYAHSGSQSIKVTPNSNAGIGADYYLYLNNQIPTIAGQTYYGYVYAKTDDFAGGQVMVVLDFFKADGSWYRGIEGPPLTGTNDWTLLSVKAVTPNEAAFVSLVLRVRKLTEQNSGSVYFDDAYLDTASLKK